MDVNGSGSHPITDFGTSGVAVTAKSHLGLVFICSTFNEPSVPSSERNFTVHLRLSTSYKSQGGGHLIQFGFLMLIKRITMMMMGLEGKHGKYEKSIFPLENLKARKPLARPRR